MNKNKHKFKFKTGIEVQAVITQFKGILVSRTTHITGCDTYGVKPQGLDDKGLPYEAGFFDENEIENIFDILEEECPDL